MVRMRSPVQTRLAAPFFYVNFLCYNETMNKLLKRGVGAWLIFIKNRLAGAVMMFISGLMMAIAGFNGNGNDTKTLPGVIAIAGGIFTFWGVYRIGHLKSDMEEEKNRKEKDLKRKTFYLQIVETVIYFIITALGVYLLINESFTNTVLDLMCGGFTILNGVMGTIYVVKHRENKNFSWKFRIGLTVLEFGMGIYFILASNSIDASGYSIMGSITTVAGVIEVFHALKEHALRDAIKDSKNIVSALSGAPKETDQNQNDYEEGAETED